MNQILSIFEKSCTDSNLSRVPCLCLGGLKYLSKSIHAEFGL